MRKADLIELASARVTLRSRKESCGGEPLLFLRPPFQVYGHDVHGHDIMNLARVLGLNIMVVGIHPDKRKGGQRYQRTGDINEFRIHFGEPNEWVCDILEAEPQGAGLLTFRAGWKGKDGEIALSEFTYSGVYVVTWARDMA